MTPTASSPAPTAGALARSFLFVPADRPDRIPKALASGADIVIADLEDAVALAGKTAARDSLREAWSTLDASSRARLAVRINASGAMHEGRDLHAADLALIAELAGEGLAAVVVPKADSAAGMATVAAACPGLAIIALVESAEAFAALDAIATAPQVVRMAFGHLDLQADLGMQPGPDQAELAPARFAVVAASRRAGLAPPIDGVTTELADPARLAEDTARAVRMGFSAKLCIHPAQIAPLHLALAPTAAELAWAQRVLDAAASSGGGAVQLEGRMIDMPVIRHATQLLARARASKATPQQ